MGARARLALLLALVLVGCVVAGGTAQAGTLLGEGFNSADVPNGGLPSGWSSPSQAGNFWRDQINPQQISVTNAINPGLSTFPDSGALPSAFEGDGVAWFGEPSTGTFCGDDSGNSFQDITQTPDDGCTSEQIESGDLDSPAFTVPVGAGASAQVTFQSWWDIEAVAGNQFDVMTVSYSIDGGANWTSLGTLNPDNPTGGASQQDYTSGGGVEVPPQWQNYLVDLTPAIANINSNPQTDPSDTVQLRFDFNTGDEHYNGFRGWLIDNVQASAPYSAAAPTIISASPACVAAGDTSSVITLQGSSIPVGSTIRIDGDPQQTVAALVPSDHTIQFTDPGLAAGGHTLQIVTPSGALSNAFPFCESAGAPGVSPGAATSGKSTTATFTGTVNPNGLPTTARFQYGLDPKYNGGGPVVYDSSTPAQSVGSDFAGHSLSASAGGLLPNAKYHVRLIASNSAGTTSGPDQTFTTRKDPPPPPPVLGKSFDVEPVSGLVFVRAPHGKSLGSIAHRLGAAVTKGSGFIPLTEARQLPAGSQVDSRQGSLDLNAATTGVGKKPQTATFSSGLFSVEQNRAGPQKGLTILSLLEGLFPKAPSFSACKASTGKLAHALGTIASAKLSSKVLQTLKATDNHGKFRTKGRYSAATVRGTKWSTSDRCDGTLTTVQRGSVSVQDFTRRKTVVVRAGHSYLAHALASHKSKKKKK